MPAEALASNCASPSADSAYYKDSYVFLEVSPALMISIFHSPDDVIQNGR